MKFGTNIPEQPMNNYNTSNAQSYGAQNAPYGNGGLGGVASQSQTGAPTINLVKGQKIDLTKGNPSLTQICIGLGWTVNQLGGYDFDLDASVFMLDRSGKCKPEGFIFYNNLKGPGVEHMGDNLVGGAGVDDDEQVKVTFANIPQDIEKIAVTVTIYDAESRRQNFGMVQNAFCRVVDTSTGHELCRYNLGENFSVETAVVICELYRHNGEWKFNAVGSGFAGGLRALGLNYGLNV